jgi:hypothetical protein
MPQAVPLALVAPTRPGLTNVGYLVRSASAYNTILTNWTAVSEQGTNTGYYPVTSVVSVPDAGAIVEFRQTSNTGTFLSAVTVDPVPANFTDMAITASTGQVTVGTNADKTGYSLTQTFPSNFSSLAITASTGQVTVGTNNDKTSYSLASSQTFSTTGSVGSVTGAVGSVTSPVTAGTVSDKTGYSLSSSQTFNLTGNITGNLSGSVGSVTGAVGSVTGAVGSVTGAVGSVTGAVTVGIINNNVITGSAVDTTAVNKIQTNLATQASVDTKASQASLDTKASQASVDALPTAPTIADAVWDEALSGHTIAGSTGKKLADTSTLTVGDIPAGLSAQQVWEYTTRALTGTQATNLANISNIPTNPLLTNDARLNNIDTTISSRSTLTAAQIRTELATELARLDVAVSTRLATAGYTTPPTTSQIATAVEAALLNDADGQALLAAIQTAVQALFDQQADIPVSTLVSLIAAQITADHGSGSYTTANLSAVALEASVQAIKAKTDNLPSDPADQSELVTLINTKASQASVDAIPTTPLLAANYTAPDNAGIAAIKAKTDNLPSDPADQSELATLISAIPTTPLLAANYTAPDNAGIAAIKAKTDNLPSDPADQSELVTLINTRLAAADYVAPNNTGILTAISALPSASTIANSVWNATLSNYLTAGSTGAKLGLASTLTVGDIPAGLTAQQVWEYATRTLTTASGLTTEQNTRLNELWRKAGLDLATPVVRILNPATGNVTETLGATTITHTETNSGNTVTTARQP